LLEEMEVKVAQLVHSLEAWVMPDSTAVVMVDLVMLMQMALEEVLVLALVIMEVEEALLLLLIALEVQEEVEVLALLLRPLQILLHTVVRALQQLIILTATMMELPALVAQLVR
jgi:hypothetical protein